MKHLKSFFVIFIITSCSSFKALEKSFKDKIVEDNMTNNLCFRVDESEKLSAFGLNLFDKNIDYVYKDSDKLNLKFNEGEDCDYIVLSSKVGDSILVGAVYKYKSGIKNDLIDYTKNVFTGKVYVAKMENNLISFDTLTVRHNPPMEVRE